MRIALDLDGVCFDFTGALHAVSVKHKLIDPSVPATAGTWDFFLHEWGWSSEEFAENIRDAIEFGELYALPGFVFPGVVEGVAHLRERGHQVHVITDRARFGPPGMAAEQTFRWLDENGIVVDSVTFAQHKSGVLQGDIAFDDAPHHWEAYRAAGTLCVLRDHRYNQNSRLAIRAETFGSFVALVDSLDHGIDFGALRALYTGNYERGAA